MSTVLLVDILFLFCLCFFAPGEQSWQVVRASHGGGHGRTRKPRRAGRSSPSPGEAQDV